MFVRKNDTVKVLSGKEKGKTAKVLEVLEGNGRVRLERLMTVKRHLKRGRSQANPEGGIIEKPGTLPASAVMVVCPKCGKASRVAHATRADGRRVRQCKKCKETFE